MDRDTNSRIDWFIFIGGSALLLAVIGPIVAFPQWSAGVIDAAFRFITHRLGAVYVATAAAVLVFLLWLAASRFGRIVLGASDGRPEHSAFSWAAMLFCAGIGASLIYWGGAEWAFYYTTPPFGIEPRSDPAILWAASYGMFHWGPVGWALYCLPTVAFCCSYYLRKLPALRLSSACAGVLGNASDAWPGRLVDLLFIVGLLGTAATGLAFGTSLVSSAVTRLSGAEDGYAMQLIIISITTLLIAVSVYRGLDKGIKVLSNINAILALLLVAFVLVAGPTIFILEMSVAALGNVAQNFITMLTWTDPLQRGNFVESWTVFYWAWWIALGPFVGMFVCKISRGRTLRSVIFGMLGFGSLGCALFFFVLGNFALDLELQHGAGIAAQAVGTSPSAAVATAIERLPGGSFWLGYVAVVAIIFAATTYDSASYTLAAGATRSLADNEHPARAHRVYWAIALGTLPGVLLFIGGLRTLQTASIVASVPLLVVYVMLGISILRMINAEEGSRNAA